MRLQLTKRADYGIRAMLALARARDERMSAPRIAAAMRIPRHFLPQVMADLARAGLVKSTAGRHGGYRPARPAGGVSPPEGGGAGGGGGGGMAATAWHAGRTGSRSWRSSRRSRATGARSTAC